MRIHGDFRGAQVTSFIVDSLDHPNTGLGRRHSIRRRDPVFRRGLTILRDQGVQWPAPGRPEEDLGYFVVGVGDAIVLAGS